MEQVTEERYVFHTDWFDKQAELIRSYLLTFYPGDNSIDMVSLRCRVQTGVPWLPVLVLGPQGHSHAFRSSLRHSMI